MEDKRKQPIYSCAPLSDPGLVRRFLSNHPKDALARHEIGAVVGYLEGTLNRRYGAHFSATVLNDLAEDALIKIITARQRFEGRSKLTTWMGTIALRASYRYFEGNFKLEGNFKKGGGGDSRESEAKADSLRDKYPLEDEENRSSENRSSEDHVANGTDKRAPIQSQFRLTLPPGGRLKARRAPRMQGSRTLTSYCFLMTPRGN